LSILHKCAALVLDVQIIEVLLGERRSRWFEGGIRSDLGIDLFPIIVVIRKCVVDGGKAQLGIVTEQRFGSRPVVQNIDDDGPHGNS